MLQVLLFNDQKYNLKTIYSLIVIKESHYKNFTNFRIELLLKAELLSYLHYKNSIQTRLDLCF